MNFGARLALALGVLAAVAALWRMLGAGAAPVVADPTVRWESAAQCRACHPEVDAEWRPSHHGIAFTNEEVRQLSDDFRKEECMDCHLPRPLATTGFGKRTLPRRTHLDEGVSCITCHLAADGGILGANDRPEVPCRPRRSAEFLSVDACMSCHNQHGTTDQWRSSRYAGEGVHCTNCHMPAAARRRADGTQRQGRSHAFPGAHDAAMLRRAGEFEVVHRAGSLRLSLTNVGAGHNFPTEERHRAVDIEYRFLDRAGAALPASDAAGSAGGSPGWNRALRCRQPYRDEPGEDTQLPAGERREVVVPIPAGAAIAQARLWYRLTPFCDDADPRSTLLEERQLELP